MSDEEEGGHLVRAACTCAFEEIDTQASPGSGRATNPSDATAEAYRRTFDVVVKHRCARSERGAGMTGTTDHVRRQDRAARRSKRPTSSAWGPPLVARQETACGSSTYDPGLSGAAVASRGPLRVPSAI